MSDTGTPIDPAAPVEQDGAIPETFTTPEPTEDPVIDPVIEEPIEAAAAESEKPKQKPWFQTRIDELTRQKHDEAREKQKALDRLALIEAGQQQDPEAAPRPVFTQTAFDQAVEEAAARKFAQEAQKAKTSSWVEAGNKAFGLEAFNEKCAMVAAMGAGDNPDFMAIVTDPETLPDGYKVIDALVANPDEAQRILAMPPARMAAALTRLNMTVKPADKPVSQAPRPITTIGGSTKSAQPADNDSTTEWLAKRNATAWDRQPRNA